MLEEMCAYIEIQDATHNQIQARESNGKQEQKYDAHRRKYEAAEICVLIKRKQT